MPRRREQDAEVEPEDDEDAPDGLDAVAGMMEDGVSLLFSMVSMLACPICAGLGRLPTANPAAPIPCECRQKARRTLEKVRANYSEEP